MMSAAAVTRRNASSNSARHPVLFLARLRQPLSERAGRRAPDGVRDPYAFALAPPHTARRPCQGCNSRQLFSESGDISLRASDALIHHGEPLKIIVQSDSAGVEAVYVVRLGQLFDTRLVSRAAAAQSSTLGSRSRRARRGRRRVESGRERSPLLRVETEDLLLRKHAVGLRERAFENELTCGLLPRPSARRAWRAA
jgi:hypothetical protein